MHDIGIQSKPAGLAYLQLHDPSLKSFPQFLTHRCRGSFLCLLHSPHKRPLRVSATKTVKQPRGQPLPQAETRTIHRVTSYLRVGSRGGMVEGLMQTTTVARLAARLRAIPFSAEFLEALVLLLYHGNLNYGLPAGAQPCTRQTAAPLPQTRTLPSLTALPKALPHQEALLQRSHRRQAAVSQEGSSE